MSQVNQEITVPPADAIRLLWKAMEVGSLMLDQTDADPRASSVTFAVLSDGGETAHTVTLFASGSYQMKTVIVLGEKE